MTKTTSNNGFRIGTSNPVKPSNGTNPDIDFDVPPMEDLDLPTHTGIGTGAGQVGNGKTSSPLPPSHAPKPKQPRRNNPTSTHTPSASASAEKPKSDRAGKLVADPAGVERHVLAAMIGRENPFFLYRIPMPDVELFQYDKDNRELYEILLKMSEHPEETIYTPDVVAARCRYKNRDTVWTEFKLLMLATECMRIPAHEAKGIQEKLLWSYVTKDPEKTWIFGAVNKAALSSYVRTLKELMDEEKLDHIVKKAIDIHEMRFGRANERLKQIRLEIEEATTDSDAEQIETLKDRAEDFLEILDRRRAMIGKTRPTFPLWWGEMVMPKDEALRPTTPFYLRNGHLIIITGKTNSGKTIIGQQIADWNASIGNRVLYVHVEDLPEDLIERSLVRYVDANQYEMQFGNGEEKIDEFKKYSSTWTGELIYYHAASDNTTVADICDVIKQVQPTLTIIDYMQKLEMLPKWKNFSRATQLALAVERIKKTAEWNRNPHPIILLAQANPKTGLPWECTEAEHKCQLLYYLHRTRVGESEKNQIDDPFSPHNLAPWNPYADLIQLKGTRPRELRNQIQMFDRMFHMAAPETLSVEFWRRAVELHGTWVLRGRPRS